MHPDRFIIPFCSNKLAQVRHRSRIVSGMLWLRPEDPLSCIDLAPFDNLHGRLRSVLSTLNTQTNRTPHCALSAVPSPAMVLPGEAKNLIPADQTGDRRAHCLQAVKDMSTNGRSSIEGEITSQSLGQGRACRVAKSWPKTLGTLVIGTHGSSAMFAICGISSGVIATR